MTRPNFEAVIYPSTPDDLTVPADAPPLFLVHADDDRMRPPLDHAVRLYAAWKKVGLPSGADFFFEIRKFIASHTDTFVTGPTTAHDYLAGSATP